jgi:hypothetical protein
MLWDNRMYYLVNLLNSEFPCVIILMSLLPPGEIKPLSGVYLIEWNITLSDVLPSQVNIFILILLVHYATYGNRVLLW